MGPSIKILSAFYFCSVFLTGCGGGGSGSTSGTATSGPVTSTETFQLRTAWINYLSESRSIPFTVTGTVSGTTVGGSGTVTFGTILSTTFEGQSALSKSVTATYVINVNGTSLPLGGTSTSYFTSNYAPLGFSGSEYQVVTATSIPTTAKVNDTGTLYVTDIYTSSSKTSKSGTSTSTFVLEPDTATTALLKVIDVEKNTSNNIISTEISTFRITPAGALTRLTSTLVEGSSSVAFTF